MKEIDGWVKIKKYTDDETLDKMITAACDAVHGGLYRVDAMKAIEAALAVWHGESKSDYAHKTVAEYESIVGYPVNDAFKIGWDMARTTNKMLSDLVSNSQEKQTMSEEPEKFKDCKCGAKDESILVKHVYISIYSSVFVVYCGMCERLTVFCLETPVNNDDIIHGAVRSWNTRPDSKPYKWKDFSDLCQANPYPGTLENAFYAARERKEG